MTAEKSADSIAVLGLGQTGKSCVRFLKSQGKSVVAVDTRENPPGLEELTDEFPDLEFRGGALTEEILQGFDELVVSPGISIKQKAIREAMEQGVSVIGDITLFRRYVKKPIVAITGSNAKSTVTTLVGKLLQDAGMNAVVAGNIGIPVMELLNQGIEADIYVLELSSFQLETTEGLNAKVATILNISEDHMDRYDDLADYARAKQRIYEGCETAVINKDDVFSEPTTDVGNKLYFLASQPTEEEFGIVNRGEDIWLATDHSPIVKASELKVKGRHNQLNALAAVAIGKALGVPMESMVCTLNEFAGLSHRCQWVASIEAVDWFNDSKGTNVGATLAAINGIGSELKGKILLIAGGEGKDADFCVLKDAVSNYVKTLILIGRDAPLIEKALGSAVNTLVVNDLSEAVSSAAKMASRGDAVLLSPACASFDMFAGFEDRGNQFMKLVHDMEPKH
ncbi:MAG: UDP-N-acetylmuramoyl-L-alanine--D-glutamate ligase [Pseudomonadales bacterium]|nr:UDP-N-acetylmuramoyl-L-alanine--D-glutamate ligase [Pseudomonadales bacterium]